MMILEATHNGRRCRLPIVTMRFFVQWRSLYPDWKIEVLYLDRLEKRVVPAKELENVKEVEE